MGKSKLHADPETARLVYGKLVLNGVSYCRPHLMLRCHLCEDDSFVLREEVDCERAQLALRPGGDPMLNRKAEKWGELTLTMTKQAMAKVQVLIDTYGKDHAQTHPWQWQKFMAEANEEERELNDRFLADVQASFDEGASQCCYWACENPDADTLLRCAGCRLAKYCCKEHQKKDWQWEHKGECHSQLPQYIKDDIEQDRQRNLHGDYENLSLNRA